MLLAMRATSGLGLLAFIFLLAVTLLSPGSVETAAKAFLHDQLYAEIRDRADLERVEGIANAATLLSKETKDKIEDRKRAIDIGLPKFIAALIAEFCRMDCAQSEAVEQEVEAVYQAYLARLSLGMEKLKELARGRYRHIVDNLIRDVRIFLASNLLAFGLLCFLCLWRPESGRQLALPFVLLLLSTVASSAIYIFGQNWFFTLLYDDYMGWSYLAYLAVIFLFLCDIALNKARLTTGVVNALGGVVAAIPC